jgi:hypothetical protein
VKSISDWNIQDVQSLVDAKEPESLKLEYKSSESFANSNEKKDEMCKDISAFANSDGGIIIYGVREEIRGRLRLPVEIDNGIDLSIYSIDSFQQMIRSRISPAVSNIIIKPIEMESGRFVIVVAIEKSISFAPHQAPNKLYYRRHNGICEPMHDYEIRDLMRRNAKPDLVLEFHEQAYKINDAFASFQLIIVIKNRSEEPAIYTSITLFLDSNLGLIQPLADFKSGHNLYFSLYDQDVTCLHLFRNLLPSVHMPIFKEKIFTVATCKFENVQIDREYVVGYELASPGFFVQKIGRIRLKAGHVEVLDF